MENLITIISAFVGAYAFSLLFHLRRKELVFAGLGGGLTWIFYLILDPFISKLLTKYIIVSIFATAYAEIMARFTKTPATCFIMPALIVLVPGASLFYTMSAFVNANMPGFYRNLSNTATMSLGIACGIVICSVLFKYIHKILNYISFKKKEITK